MTTSTNNRLYNSQTEFSSNDEINQSDIVFNNNSSSIRDSPASDPSIPSSTKNESKITEIVFTQVVKDAVIQYTDTQFKNQTLLLCRCSPEHINNFWDIYSNIIENNNYLGFSPSDNDTYTTKKPLTTMDELHLTPVVNYKKKFYLSPDEAHKGSIDKDVEDDISKSWFKAKKKTVINYIKENNNPVNKKETLRKDFFQRRRDIKKTKTGLHQGLHVYHQQLLYDLERPFEQISDAPEYGTIDYTPKNNRNAVRHCIYMDPESVTDPDLDPCVNIDNNHITTEKVNLLSPQNVYISKRHMDPPVEVYPGDQVKLMGYMSSYTSINEDDNNKPNTQIFSLEKYLNDIQEMRTGDSIRIYPNVIDPTTSTTSNSPDFFVNGTIHEVNSHQIKNENITRIYNINQLSKKTLKITLNKSIPINGIKTNILVYDTRQWQQSAMIFPDNERLLPSQVYSKPMLFDRDVIIVFPTNRTLLTEIYNSTHHDSDIMTKDNHIINNLLSLILPSVNEILELAPDNDTQTSYPEFFELLSTYHVNTKSLSKDDLYAIDEAVIKNIKSYKKNNGSSSISLDLNIKIVEATNKRLSKLVSNPVGYLTRTEITDSTILDIKPSEMNNLGYSKYIEYGTYIDGDVLRTRYLRGQPDVGYNHYHKFLKQSIETQFKELQLIDLDGDTQSLQQEKEKQELMVKKHIKKDTDCETILISKFYYNQDLFKHDQKRSGASLENHYSILQDQSGLYSTLFHMERGEWVKKMVLSDSAGSMPGKNELERNPNAAPTIRMCDGLYYLDLRKNSCMFNDLNGLCERRDSIRDNKHLSMINRQLKVLKEFNDFKTHHVRHLRYLENIGIISKRNKDFGYKAVPITKNMQRDPSLYEGDPDFEDLDQLLGTPDPTAQFITGTSSTASDIIATSSAILTNNSNEADKFSGIRSIVNGILEKSKIIMESKYIEHIVMSVDYFLGIFVDLEIRSIITRYPKFKGKLKSEVLQAIYKTSADQTENMLRKTIQICTGLIIIMIQMIATQGGMMIMGQNSSCSKYFSLMGYPASHILKQQIKTAVSSSNSASVVVAAEIEDDKSEDEKDTQLYKYITCAMLSIKDYDDLFKRSSRSSSQSRLQFLSSQFEKMRNQVLPLIISDSNTKRSSYSEVIARNTGLLRVTGYSAAGSLTVTPKQFKVWLNFKPEIQVNRKEEPNNVMSRYLHALLQALNKDVNLIKWDSVMKMNVFKNICCMEQIQESSDYYNFYRNRSVDISKLIRDIKKSPLNKQVLKIFRRFLHLSTTKYRIHLDNWKIFDENASNKIKHDVTKILSIKKISSIDDTMEIQEAFTDNITKTQTFFEQMSTSSSNVILQKIYKHPEHNLMKLFEDQSAFDSYNKWSKFTTEIDNSLTELIKFSSERSTPEFKITASEEANLRKYLIRLSDNSHEDLIKIRKNSQKNIRYGINTIISQIVGGYSNDSDKNIKRKRFSTQEVESLINIRTQSLASKNQDSIGQRFKVLYPQNKSDKSNLSKYIEGLSINMNKVNFKDDSKQGLHINLNDSVATRADVLNNLTKNIFLQNYMFIIILTTIYSNLMNISNSELFGDAEEDTTKPKRKQKNTDSQSASYYITEIIQRLRTTVSNSDTDDVIGMNVDLERHSQKLNLAADIVSHILRDYHNTITDDIVDNSVLKAERDRLRDIIKNIKMNRAKEQDTEIYREYKHLGISMDIVGIHIPLESEEDLNIDKGLMREETQVIDIDPDTNQEVKIFEDDNPEWAGNSDEMESMQFLSGIGEDEDSPNGNDDFIQEYS
jgi:hypothetical protein